MQSNTGVALRVMCYGLAAAIAVVALNGVPATASAAELTTISHQILPLEGPNTCPDVQATNFTPYVYDNAVNSFEFRMPDASYVAVLGQVGDTSIPLRFMTRRIDAVDGSLWVHVDTPSIPVSGTMQVQITMLSTHGPGSPVCLTIVSTTSSLAL